MANHYNNVIFIVTERHMMENYTYLCDEIKKHILSYDVVYLEALKSNSKLNRIKNGESHIKVLRNTMLARYGACIKDTLIIFSNAEGFVIQNKSLWMPTLKDCKEVYLMHGFAKTNLVATQVVLRKIINKILQLILRNRIRYLGGDFGESKADLAIVFGYVYKNFLIKMGWPSQNIIVSARLLKPTIVDKDAVKDSCLLLLQDLSFMMDKELMLSIFKEIVCSLSRHYKMVLVRKHPKMSDELLQHLSKNKNVCFSSSSLSEDIMKCEKAYSLFSAALLDCFLAGKEVVAIKTKQLPAKSYVSFNRVVDLKNLDDYLILNKNNDVSATIKNDYLFVNNDIQSDISKILESKY